MEAPRIKRDGFEIYPEKLKGYEITVEIDVEDEGVEHYYQGNISLTYKEIKELFDYITQKQLEKE